MKYLTKKITAFALTAAVLFMHSLTPIKAASISDAFCSESVIFDENFENTTLEKINLSEGLKFTDETTESICTDPKNSNNMVLRISRPLVSPANNTFVSIPFTDSAIDSGIVDVEFDILPTTNGVAAGITDDGTWPAGVMSILTEKIKAYNATNATECKNHTISASEWSHIKYQINVDNQTFNLWVDNHQCATNYKFRQATGDTFDPLRYITFWLVNVDNAVDFYADNIKVSLAENAIANDNFNNSATVLNNFWSPIISKTETGFELVNRTSNNSTDKAVYVNLTNKSSFDGIQYTFNSTSNTLLFNLDYKIPTAYGRNLNIYFKGKEGSTSRDSISMVISHSSIKYINQSIEDASGTGVTLKSGINNSGWQNLKLVLYTKDNSAAVFHNDKYIGTMPYRFKGNNDTLHNIRVGGSSAGASITDGVYFDNITLIDTNADKPVLISDALYTWNFNGTSEKLPSSFSGNGKLVPKDGNSTDRVLSIDGASATTVKSLFSLPKAITTGKADITFKFKTNNTTATNQFYLYSGNTIAFTASIKGALTVLYADNLHKTKVSGVNANTWHTLTFHLDLDNKTYAYTLNNNPKTRYYPLRNFDNLTAGITNGYFGMTGATSSTTLQIDDFSISSDITNYGKMDLICSSPLKVDNESKAISGIAENTSVASALAKLSTSTPYTSFYITDSFGDKKESSDIVKYNDFIFTEQDEYKVGDKYTILAPCELSVRSITVNGNEYSQHDAIPVFGNGEARIIIKNNLPVEKEFDVYISVLGTKLYSAKYINKIKIAPTSEERLVSDINIPELDEDAVLKIMLFDGDGSLSPLTECAVKLINNEPEITMPNIFSDNMILQRNQPVNIFGIAPTGSSVDVSFGDCTASGMAVNNEFLVQLPEIPASNIGKDLIVTVSNSDDIRTFTYSNVVVGDVFYGSGQSNMQNPLSWFETDDTSSGPVEGAEFVENVRYFEVSNVTSPTNRTPGMEAWIEATEDNYKTISATLHTMSMALRNLGVLEPDVPIGLVKCAVGSTGIAEWTGADVLLKPEYSLWHDEYWNGVLNNRARHTDYYYAMVKSVTPYTFKAAVWYQGEHDCTVDFYDKYASDMITQMRSDFGYDIPYIVVQLPGFANGKKWDNFRLIQWNIQNLTDNTYVAVTNDTGNIANIHPSDKGPVGERIARQLIYNVYGKDIPYTGPVFDNATAKNSDVIVECRFVNDGIHGALTLQNDNLCAGFEVSADNTTWHNATSVQISDNKFIVSSSKVSSPKYIRYAYTDTPLKNAGSISGADNTFLPMAPFNEAIN